MSVAFAYTLIVRWTKRRQRIFGIWQVAENASDTKKSLKTKVDFLDICNGTRPSTFACSCLQRFQRSQLDALASASIDGARCRTLLSPALTLRQSQTKEITRARSDFYLFRRATIVEEQFGKIFDRQPPC